MSFYKAVISYDGRFYSGFQRLNEKETVQGTLEKALSFLFQTETLVHGAGRTDAGVSARGQVISFSSSRPLEDLDYTRKTLNRLLPPSIACLSLEEADPSFDARRSAIAKEYSYRLSYIEKDPLSTFVAHFAVPSFDADLFKEAFYSILGKHDFRNFTTKGEDRYDFVRTIYGLRLEKKERGILDLRFLGDGFMTYMIRLLVGSLVKVAIEKFSPEEFHSFLDPKKRDILSFKAPAEGLILERVLYNDEELQEALKGYEARSSY